MLLKSKDGCRECRGVRGEEDMAECRTKENDAGTGRAVPSLDGWGASKAERSVLRWRRSWRRSWRRRRRRRRCRQGAVEQRAWCGESGAWDDVARRMVGRDPLEGTRSETVLSRGRLCDNRIERLYQRSRSRTKVQWDTARFQVPARRARTGRGGAWTDRGEETVVCCCRACCVLRVFRVLACVGDAAGKQAGISARSGRSRRVVCLFGAEWNDVGQVPCSLSGRGGRGWAGR